MNSKFLPRLIEAKIGRREGMLWVHSFPFSLLFTCNETPPAVDYIIEAEMYLAEDKAIHVMQCSHMRKLFRLSLPVYMWEKGQAVCEGPMIFIPEWNAAPGTYAVKIRLIDENTLKPIPLILPDDHEATEIDMGFVKIKPGMEYGPENETEDGSLFTDAILESEQALVYCDLKIPQILGFRLKTCGAFMPAQWDVKMPRINIYSEKRKSFRSVYATDIEDIKVNRIEKKRIEYKLSVAWDGEPAVEIEICFSINDRRITGGYRCVNEQEGYKLSSIEMGAVLSANTKHDNPYMVIPIYGGRLINIKSANPAGTSHNMSSINSLLCEMIYNSKMGGMLYSSAIDDVVKSRVVDLPDGTRYGSLEIELTHRYTKEVARTGLSASDSLDTELLRPGIKAYDSSEFSISLFDDYLGDGKVDWQDAAAQIRETMHFRIPGIYKNAFINKILIDRGPADIKKGGMTFDQALEIVKKIYILTGGSKQIVYLVGFQHNGHDTGYPDIFTVNECAGGYQKLRMLINEGRVFNAVVSFHDNYDDAYMHSPAWDPSVMLKNKDGSLYEGWVWAGGRSYILSTRDYLKKGALERVNRTIDMYSIRESYHIDVLSCEVTRPNLDPANPVSSTENVAAKLRIIQEFNKRGIDITSEGFTAPFLGHIGFGGLKMNESVLLYGTDVGIPLMPFIFHGVSTYTTYAEASSMNQLILQKLKYGSMCLVDVTYETTERYMNMQYYLITAPMFELVERKIVGYMEDSGWETIIYEGKNSYIKVNRAYEQYKVVVDGVLVSIDYTSFVKLPDNSGYAIYSAYEDNVRFSLPVEWKNISEDQLIVKSMIHNENISFSIENDEILIQVKADNPCSMKMR